SPFEESLSIPQRQQGGILMATKKRKPTRRSKAVIDRRLRDGLDEVDALMSRRRWVEARQLLDQLVHTFPQRGEVLERLIDVALRLEDTQSYHFACEHLYLLRPHDRQLPFMLVIVYLKNGWMALALSMARHALVRDPSNEQAAKTRSMLPELESL